MQHELLFEIGTEEIPAGYIIPAINSINNIMTKKLSELGLTHGEIRNASTPRRLTICVKDLIEGQSDSREEVMGPPKAAAFDKDNKPTKAAEGFARSKGATLEDIQITETPKGEYLMVVVEKKGEKTAVLLPEVLAGIIQQLPFPKSMRWGSGRAGFARPIQWIVARYGNQIIPCEINNVCSGSSTRGHRFMAPNDFEITDYNNYLKTLRKAHVLADQEERKKAVIKEVEEAAAKTGGRIMTDDALLDTVTNLIEEPHAVCGSFDEKFLALPDEVLITSMREHQKYFAVVDDNGKLMPHFIAVNNTDTKDHALAAQGHQRVLRARLEDALFFFNEDKKHKLADRTDKLSGVVFQSGLGTMQEKTSRVTELAAWLAKKVAPQVEKTASRAAELAKADLLTDMVNEFPSLQGVMGRAYALLDQETPEVAQAIAEHYMPVRAGSSLPESDEGAIVGLADRIDSIAGSFGIGKKPTGSTDPYGLRRLSLGLLNIIDHRGYSLSVQELADQSVKLYGDKITVKPAEARKNILDFIEDRYINDRISRGKTPAAVEAVTSINFDDLIDCDHRIEALMAVQNEETFNILAGSFKRVKNIIKGHSGGSIKENMLKEEAEKNLYQVFQQVQDQTAPLFEKKEYEQAMQAILKMKEPVDNFFDDVMVMADDERLKTNRLNLLTAISGLFLKIGDFSRMS